MKITFLKKIRLGKASWTKFGSILTPKRVPKGSQIGAKMASKNDQKIRFLIALKRRKGGRALQVRSEPEPWRG